MKSEARIFLGVAAFCWLAAIGYGVWTSLPNGFQGAGMGHGASQQHGGGQKQAFQHGKRFRFVG